MPKGRRKKGRHIFQTLRLQLTLRFAVATLATLLVVVFCISLFLFFRILITNWRLSPRQWISVAEHTALPSTRKILEGDPENRGLIELWLKVVGSPISYHRLFAIGDVEITMRMTRSVSAILLDGTGRILGSTSRDGNPRGNPGEHYDSEMLGPFAEPVQYVLSGGRNPEQLVRILSDDRGFVIALPVYSEDETKLLGVLAAQFGELPSGVDALMYTVKALGITLLLVLTLSGGVALLFAFLTARVITNRLKIFGERADRWSAGDFSRFIDDGGLDEIGRLADRLDAMAVRTAILVEQQRKTAVAGERQRMARDLHDSVKQQALAASFQLGAALSKLSDLNEKRLEEVPGHVREAEHLLDDIRSELTSLVEDLYSEWDDGGDPNRFFMRLIKDWYGRTGIPVRSAVTIPGKIPEKTGYTFYRILQEALSNVARHSGADLVELEIQKELGGYVLDIRDNGCGFNREKETPGRGLLSMRDRVCELGGTLTIESWKGCTRLRIVIPEETGHGQK